VADTTKIPLEPDKYYHIYNHANGRENLFVNDGNFNFFLQRYAKHINPIADTYAYCLMPNHFHLAVKIKSAQHLQGFKNLEGVVNLEGFISQQFSNLFNSYSKAFNKQENRKGSLFIPRFERKHIDSDNYFKQLIHYIHYNPVHHGFVDDLRNWKHSSFESFFSKKATKLKREEVMEWFENKENFWAFHQREIDEKMVLELEYF
jgi:REP element-mobilizing transposase RayT